MAQRLKCLPAIQETRVRSLGREEPLEKEMATHCSILAWKVPRTEEPGGLQSMGSQRAGHDWATNTYTYTLVVSYWSNLTSISDSPTFSQPSDEVMIWADFWNWASQVKSWSDHVCPPLPLGILLPQDSVLLGHQPGFYWPKHEVFWEVKPHLPHSVKALVSLFITYCWGTGCRLQSFLYLSSTGHILTFC